MSVDNKRIRRVKVYRSQKGILWFNIYNNIKEKTISLNQGLNQ